MSEARWNETVQRRANGATFTVGPPRHCESNAIHAHTHSPVSSWPSKRADVVIPHAVVSSRLILLSVFYTVE